MKQTSTWQGRPYYPINLFYKKVFGHKIYKIPVSTAQTCPNREGLKGMKTCNFCDAWGSAAYPEIRQKQLHEQILENQKKIYKRTKAKYFLVYFQSYTNTFAKIADLRKQFETASQFDFVKGFVVGTRPDCISDAVINLWNEYSGKKFISVELGVQSFNNSHLSWIRRGHTAQKSIWAIQKIKEKSTVNLGIHLIFGLPQETKEQIINTALKINALPIDNVKLHNLHVLKNTPLETDYKKGLFKPISQKEYFLKVKIFLQHLNPDIAVHRLAALASRPHELIAPLWTGKKMEVYQNMIDYMKKEKAWQGQLV